MSYKDEWLVIEANDDIDETEHREPSEELLFYRAAPWPTVKWTQCARTASRTALWTPTGWGSCPRTRSPI